MGGPLTVSHAAILSGKDREEAATDRRSHRVDLLQHPQAPGHLRFGQLGRVSTGQRPHQGLQEVQFVGLAGRERRNTHGAWVTSRRLPIALVEAVF